MLQEIKLEAAAEFIRFYLSTKGHSKELSIQCTGCILEVQASRIHLLMAQTSSKSDAATLEGLQNFGAWFRRSRKDSRYWPPELRRWFERKYSFEDKYTLTQALLCKWLADVANDESLEGYTYRIKTIEKWADIKDENETRVKNIKEMNLTIALGLSGFLSLDDCPVFLDSIWIFREVLLGRINPLKDKWPLDAEGSGIGKRVAAFLEGVVFSTSQSTLLDLVTRAEFVAGQWKEKDITQGGWFFDLIKGNIFDVKQLELEKIAKCTEAYLRKHRDKNIVFTVNDLLSILAHRKLEQESSPLEEDIRKADSELANVVIEFCRDLNSDLETFVTEELGILWQRWIELEDGAKPTPLEANSLSFLLDKPRGHFEHLWSSQYEGSDQTR